MNDTSDITVVRGCIATLASEPVLSAAEHERAAHLPDAARAAFVAGRTLLRSVLGRSIEIVEDADTKPRLADGSGVDFSISHAGEHVLVAIARGRRIGVDVEQVVPRRNLTAIAEAAACPLTPDAFTAWWVRVEAACKATGEGLVFPIDDTRPEGLVVRDVAMPAGYFAAVAFDRSAA